MNARHIAQALSILGMVLLATAFAEQQGKWTAPATADQKKNPLAGDAAAAAAGKAIYTKECASCHGKKGKGDGPSAAALGISAGDLSAAASQAQSDGAYFWKVQTGKKPMPTFQKKLSEDQIWQVVNYMRTLNASNPK